MLRFTPETIPPFGDSRISYVPAHHAEDISNIGIEMRIDGRYVYILDAYPFNEDSEKDGVPDETPTEREVYNAYVEILKAQPLAAAAAVNLQVELTPDEADLLALLLKRLTYSQILACTDGDNNEDQAYAMQDVKAKIRLALAEEGCDPR